MKTKLIVFLLCIASLSVMGQGTIVREKCKTCGKVLSQCQYKGKHPTPSETNNGSKPEQKTQKKQTSAKTSETKKSKTPSKTNMRADSKQSPNTKSKKDQKPSNNSSKAKRTSRGYENGHEWVDLGLSVKWATCNVGATSPNDLGGCYAWGETKTKANYIWNNCFDCLDGKGNSWNIYKKNGQNEITPSSGHDTARENWGGKWRMPSATELDELCTKCKWTWTEGGFKIIGPNGNSIFLPATGWSYDTELYYLAGAFGVYWSNMLSPSDSKRARTLSINYEGDHDLFEHDRGEGCSIRPVME